MKALIVEDDLTSRKLLARYLEPYGEVDVAVDGKEGLKAVKLGWEEKIPYDLICLDILMPEMDGHMLLQKVRKEEHQRGIGGLKGVKVIMTTALAGKKNILGSFRKGCEAYMVKPINKKKFIQLVEELKLNKDK